MEQIPSTFPAPEPVRPGPAGWVATWIKAVTQPNEQSLLEIAESPEASDRNAYIWVFLAGVVSGLVQAVASAFGSSSMMQALSQVPGMDQYLPASTGGIGSSFASVIAGVCLSPIAGLMTVIFFALGVAIIQWIAKLFGGAGNYSKLLYVMAAITVPLSVVSSVLSLIQIVPLVGICILPVSLLLSFYGLALEVMAVKAVNRFGYGQAVGSVFLPGCAVMLVCACVIGASLLLLGPVIGNVFSQIH